MPNFIQDVNTDKFFRVDAITGLRVEKTKDGCKTYIAETTDDEHEIVSADYRALITEREVVPARSDDMLFVVRRGSYKRTGVFLVHRAPVLQWVLQFNDEFSFQLIPESACWRPSDETYDVVQTGGRFYDHCVANECHDLLSALHFVCKFHPEYEEDDTKFLRHDGSEIKAGDTE